MRKIRKQGLGLNKETIRVIGGSLANIWGGAPKETEGSACISTFPLNNTCDMCPTANSCAPNDTNTCAGCTLITF